MPFTEVILLTVHVLSSSIWLASNLLIVFALHPLWARYSSYSMMANFRLEYIQITLRVLNVVLAVTAVSGVGLVGLYGRDVLATQYSLIFSAKMLLLLALFFLVQPYYRMVNDEKQQQAFEKIKGTFNLRSVAILAASLGIFTVGYVLEKVL